MVYYVLIFCGSLFASLAISYAWWCKIRIVNLRQSLFDERDRLYDCALRLHAFNDPAYKNTREHINQLAKNVEFVTIPIFAFLMTRHVGHRTHLSRTDNRELQNEIEHTLKKCSETISHYLLYHTATGLAAVLVLQLNLAVAKKIADHHSNHWVHSRMPGESNTPPADVVVA